MLPNLFNSFDIFDTCLTRTYARPSDLFYDLAEKVMPILCPYGFGRHTLIEFVRLRSLAERLARQTHRNSGEDITLSDVYRTFSAISPWLCKPEILVEAELALEKSCLRPIPEILSRIQALHSEGHSILFISDMYLPAHFITECLSLHGFYGKGDSIYVSGEIGLTKHTGSLFAHILRQNNILPRQLVHLGDNPHSDLRVPLKMGIQASLFAEAHLTPHERLGASFIESGFDSKLIGCSRLLRLSRQEVLSKEFIAITSDVIAPTLTAYVAWLLADAKRQDIGRLYFVSRDGQILLKIAQRLTFAWGGPECRYLYGSRQAWFLSSVTEISRSQLDWLLAELESKTPRYILQRLHIVAEQVEAILADYGFYHRLDEPLIAHDEHAVWALLQHPVISAMILNNAENSRAMALAYFSQEGLLSYAGRWALVDIGWTLKCQKSLQAILDNAGIGTKIYGYYFGVRTALIDTSLLESYAALLEDGKQHCNNSISCRNGLFYAGTMALIEHVFTMADHPTVISYQKSIDGVIPVFASMEAKSTVEKTITVHELILKYADASLTLGFTVNHIPALIQRCVASLQLLLTHPSSEEAQSVCRFTAHIDQGHAIARPIATPLSWREVARIFFNQFGWLPRYELSGPVWLEGSAALSYPAVRWAMLGLLATKRLVQRLRVG